MSNYDKILDHAIENSLNVLMIGKHGVGKTAIIKQCFESHNLKWRYFSASTMDPWVDFIGVPKEMTDERGTRVLELVRPAAFAYDEVEALFFDELNRAPKKVRNAVMELIQFGSINGKEFKNLKVVWGAINPDDDEQSNYDVEKLDPAQLDRFQIQIDVAYKPDMKFFRKTYGEMGELAVKWWSDQKPDVKNLVSPRRLDYALSVIRSGGDVRYVLNSRQVNVSEFTNSVNRGNPIRDLETLLTKSEAEIRKTFSDHNELKRLMSDLVEDERFMKGLAHYLPEEETLSQLQPKKRRGKFAQYVEANPQQFEHVMDAVLNNVNAYKREVVTAFNRHKQAQQTVKTGATAPSKTLTPLTTAPTSITLGGKTLDPRKVTICFTGILEGYTREQATKLVESFGCKTSSAATHGVTHLVCGDKVGAMKTNMAKQYGIEMLTQKQFEEAFVNATVYSNKNISQSLTARCVRTHADGTKDIEINGRIFHSKALTHDSMYETTGERFRMNDEQRARCANGSLTREQAFQEWIKNL